MYAEEEKFAQIQNDLRQKISLEDSFSADALKTVAGVDLAYWQEGDTERAVCCIVVIDAASGEVIEKKETDFAAEVAAQAGI